MSPESVTPEAAITMLLSLESIQGMVEGGTPKGLEIGGTKLRELQEQLGYTELLESRSVTDDPFEVMSHEDIWDKANPLSGDDISRTSSSWQALGVNAAMDAGAFALAISRQIGTNWQGPAAEAAGQGVGRYASSAVELRLSADSLADKVRATFDGVTATKSQLPPPVPYAGGEKFLDAASWLARTILPGDIKSVQHMHEEAEQAARTVMKTHYAPAIRQAAGQIPVIPQAVNPLNGSETFTVPGGGWSTGPGSAGGGTYQAPSGGAGSPGSGSPDGSGAAEGTATQSASSAPPPSTGSPTAAGGANTANGGGGSGGSGGATPNSAGTPAAGSTGGGLLPGPGGSGARSSSPGGNGSRFGGGSGGSGGRGSSGGGSFGGSGSGSGAGGFGSGAGRGGSGLSGPLAGAGSGAGASGGALGGGSTTGRAGAAGMGGMGGMAPAAGRGGGGDDDVHKTPGYLIDAVNGDELIGSLPLVAPPVLGE